MRHPFVRLAVVLAIGIALLSAAPSAAPQANSGRRVAPTHVTAITAAEFFAPAKVWTASLTMSAEAWAAMQPRRGASNGEGRSGGSVFLGPPGGRNGTAAHQGIEFDYVHATLQINDWTFRDVAVRYKSNNSYFRATRAGSDKISLKVDFNKYVKGQKLAGPRSASIVTYPSDLARPSPRARLSRSSKRVRRTASHETSRGRPPCSACQRAPAIALRGCFSRRSQRRFLSRLFVRR
jgi:hypothetical protein